MTEIGDALAGQVEDSTGSTNKQVNRLSETENIVAKRGTSGGDHDFDAEVLSERLCDLTCLESKLTGGHQKDGLNFVLLGVELFERRDDIGSCLARTVLGTRQDIATGECDRDGLFLDGGGALETGFKDAHKEFTFEKVIFELVAFCVEHIFGLRTLIFGKP